MVEGQRGWAGLRRADWAGPSPREGILKTAKVLVEDTKVLVQNAAGSQEKLAQAAQSSVATITRLADVVKLGAASLGAEDPETQVSAPHASLWPEPLPVPPFPPTDRSLCSRPQVVLINAVKDVAKALGDLISATKAAAGKVGDDPAVWQLKSSAKVGGKESSCPGGVDQSASARPFKRGRPPSSGARR